MANSTFGSSSRRCCKLQLCCISDDQHRLSCQNYYLTNPKSDVEEGDVTSGVSMNDLLWIQ
uniref:Uncharacterized protein n=1 Tax=Ditylenchus dipsaci TaxID=166011 RepID=A0A915CZA7_9BILA